MKSFHYRTRRIVHSCFVLSATTPFDWLRLVLLPVHRFDGLAHAMTQVESEVLQLRESLVAAQESYSRLQKQHDMQYGKLSAGQHCSNGD